MSCCPVLTASSKKKKAGNGYPTEIDNAKATEVEPFTVMYIWMMRLIGNRYVHEILLRAT
jgi:hypothetical protein